jgi:hypothetical protein
MTLDTLTAAFTRAETYLKVAVVAVATGAVAAAGQLIVNSQDQAILFTPAGLMQLKHAFMAGAVLSLIGLFTKSPLTPTSK